MAVRSARSDDADAIANIYNPFIERTHITFEETPISGADVLARMAAIEGLGLPWLVWDVGEVDQQPRILAYAYAGHFRERASYRFTVETAIYVAQAASGKGMGRKLYSQLLDELRLRRRHRAIGGIALPNEASVKLHEQLGFRWVGTFTQVGRKFDKWIDVGFWELDLTAKPAET